VDYKTVITRDEGVGNRDGTGVALQRRALAIGEMRIFQPLARIVSRPN